MSIRPEISIVDDEATVRQAIGNLLRSFGFNVKSYASAEEFLSATDAASSACILADVRMGGMSGIDLFNLLRSRDIQTPVIFLTASSYDLVRAQVGPDVPLLQKPFDGEKLVSMINEAAPGVGDL
ncbi:response regulator [Rhizobium sp. CNPSo 3968]|uniref:response regulator transcription factor n=1 Tax=Rhizobium sp. CNPSo 3968 TaxID=3021408 RepID=UPI000DDF54F3